MCQNVPVMAENKCSELLMWLHISVYIVPCRNLLIFALIYGPFIPAVVMLTDGTQLFIVCDVYSERLVHRALSLFMFPELPGKDWTRLLLPNASVWLVVCK